ncbi:hypothetical protein PFISCL1PPCAC_17954 [Pristionchus fissidentatus]|uniref:F-box domain-containing protein n=1 Tax=Pristionchus fissidentatus TaxID=1538716 RepID=A0AAV5W6Q7_9BILA|nr:hypothetical protein PFISCL1PPCAC_17954 [Pristionchus fissidentatus]
MNKRCKFKIIVSFFFAICDSKAQAMTFPAGLPMNSSFSMLEMLPNEILVRIFSSLGLQDRRVVRASSQTLKKAISKSDLTAESIRIEFNRRDGDHMTIFRSPYDDGSLSTIFSNPEESIREWLGTLSKRLFFRRLRTGQLLIVCNASPVEEATMRNVTGLLDFQSFSLQFSSRNQPSVMDFVRSSKKRIDSLEVEYFIPDLQEILQLPRMSYFCLERMSRRYADEQVLAIAGREHATLSLRVNLLQTQTLLSLIEIVRRSKLIQTIRIDVPTAYFHEFLASFGLHEERQRLMDVSDPASPVFVLNFEYSNKYYLDMGAAFLCTYDDGVWRPLPLESRRMVRIENRRISECLRPMHALDLARMQGGE